MDRPLHRPNPAITAGIVSALALALAGHLPVAAATSTRTYPAGKPPFYRGEPAEGGVVAYLPVRVEPGPPGTPESWSPVNAMGRLAEEMTSRLGTLDSRLVPAAGSAGLERGMPRLYLGCALDDTGECATDTREMVFQITGPSGDRRERIAAALREQDADLLLLTTLTFSDHWLRQKNLKGSKEIPLGTGYAQPAPWLTSLETPLQVLQLAGILVDAEGKVVRSGVEGLFARRTAFKVSVAGLQRVFGEAEVEQVRKELRRNDVDGRPLVWEAALDALVRQLLDGTP